MALENDLYAQVVMTRRRGSGDKKEKYDTKNITSKDNQQEKTLI